MCTITKSAHTQKSLDPLIYIYIYIYIAHRNVSIIDSLELEEKLTEIVMSAIGPFIGHHVRFCKCKKNILTHFKF